VENIRAQEWYNGEIPRHLNGYMDDKANRLIGWATMRQLRVKPKPCDNQRIASRCIGDYSWFNEERRSFAPGWNNETNITYSSSILNAFQYRSSDELNSYLTLGQHGNYFGGGYLYEFRGRLSEIKSNLSLLHQLEWINNQTRAVLIQLTLYNPNVRLMTAVTLLLEFLPSGGISPSARFEPITFSGTRISSRRTVRHVCVISSSVHIVVSNDLHSDLHTLHHLFSHLRNPGTHSTETRLFPTVLVVD
jgi:polycystin 1L2